MFYISSCTVQYYSVLSTTTHVRLLYAHKRVSQSVSHVFKGILFGEGILWPGFLLHLAM